ncbi:hypothetical protein HMPREF1316_1651 [Olsenella profusa F0195]|uniref:Uncharacterized protein n=1 Tax=Olsenella profusa F0195 TaxID=1125712 RepID=U2VA39_9ACTN|nr:hypothetical protein HMPREF1316_1651 [Olsenella profusa F0195]
MSAYDVVLHQSGISWKITMGPRTRPHHRRKVGGGCRMSMRCGGRCTEMAKQLRTGGCDRRTVEKLVGKDV